MSPRVASSLPHVDLVDCPLLCSELRDCGFPSVSVNEPMSGLQRGVEELEYYDVLEEALQCNTSLERLLRLCMFVISPYSGAQMRTHKPFNPFLGKFVLGFFLLDFFILELPFCISY